MRQRTDDLVLDNIGVVEYLLKFGGSGAGRYKSGHVTRRD